MERGTRQDMDQGPPLPMQDRRRRLARDAKLNAREERLADRARATKRVCPCNICCGENRSLRYRGVVREHLKKYGRHPYHRGSTEVRKFCVSYHMSLWVTFWFLINVRYSLPNINDCRELKQTSRISSGMSKSGQSLGSEGGGSEAAIGPWT